jgi:L-seryl-tRNA(Ser) seleniumtransferase
VPRTDAVLGDPRLVSAASRLGRPVVKAAAAEALAQVRNGQVPPEAAADLAVSLLPRSVASLRPVLNCTGVVLHTNLGRAPLSSAALVAVVQAGGYTDVELDLASGGRSTRGEGALAALREQVPDAGDVLVVNNGAAALLLAMAVLGGEVLVSRGELVEIGDGFRLTDLISSVATIKEVGTTNRTHLSDYAVDERTGCVLKVHPSNFTVSGFTSSVEVSALSGLGAHVVVDVGSGLLHPEPLLPDEPDVTTALREGASLVTCSGDKLLGGPQAGLVFGAAALVERLRRHPMYRAVRCDKLTLAALEATLRGPVSPVWQAIRAVDLEARCRLLAEKVGAEVVPTEGAVGGGGAPGVVLPSWAVALDPDLAAGLRTGEPAVVGRVHQGRLLLDLRCVHPDDDAAVAAAVLACTS